MNLTAGQWMFPPNPLLHRRRLFNVTEEIGAERIIRN
jgi:hypothetical protein